MGQMTCETSHVPAGPIELLQIDKNPLNESYFKAPSKFAIKEESNAEAKKASADSKFKAATAKIYFTGVGIVPDHDFNTELVNVDLSLVELSLKADLPKASASQVKTVSLPVFKRTRSRGVDLAIETKAEATLKDFMHKIVKTN